MMFFTCLLHNLALTAVIIHVLLLVIYGVSNIFTVLLLL